MASRPAIGASGCDPKAPSLAKPMSPSLVSHRSSSVKPSMRSSISRITLVGYDASLDPEIDVMYGTTNTARELSWFDHLRAVLCMPRRPKLETFPTAAPEEPSEPKDRKDLDSPWVLPVYVLSTERDMHRHLIPKEAKCTIDTGNLQGNIVSRAFLVDVLGYSEANFHKLTKEEEGGGTGITGHKLIPEAAIYLTWYHSNSTRVFRDMRFLISEHPMYDLIIGARSIQKNNILDVPNLMDASAGNIVYDEEIYTEELRNLEAKMNKAKAAYAIKKRQVNKLKLSEEKTKEALDNSKEKKEYDNAKDVHDQKLRAEYTTQIGKAEKNRDSDRAAKLRQRYEQRFSEPILEEEKTPKNSGKNSKAKGD